MPITNNPTTNQPDFTPEEFTAAITANPALVEHVRTGFGTKYKVFDDAGLNEYGTQERAKVTKESAEYIEKSVKEIAGIEKIDPSEKWTSLYDRALKTTTESLKAERAKIAALEGKSDITAAERQQLADYRELVKAKDKAIADKDLTHQSELNQLRAETKILTKIGSVETRFKKIPELQDAIAIVKEKVLSDMTKAAKVTETGEIIFFDAEKKPLKNSDNTFVTAEQLYETKMEKFIDKGIKNEGAGGNGDGPPNPATPNGIKTQLALNNFISSLGLMQGTPAFTKKFNELNGSKLPLY